MKAQIEPQALQLIAPRISGIVERRPSDLRPWRSNPRKHSQEQLAVLMASIEKFGFLVPVLVDEDGVILCGHARVAAAIALALPTIPTREVAGLSETYKRGFVIADNKIAMMSTWDLGLLASEFELLIQADFEIETTGFRTAEIDLMFDDPGAESVDDLRADDVSVDAVTKPGDLWMLGDHRLYCGDALDPLSYAAVMGTDSAQMVMSDPPFNVPIDGHVGNSGKIQHREFAMASGEMSRDQFTAFLRTAISNMHAVACAGAIFYLFIDWRHVLEMLLAAQPVLGEPKQLICWRKDNAGMGTFYRSQHELIYLFKKGAAPHINNFELGQHGRYRTNVWDYPGAATFKGQKLLALHPTVKPVGMIADAIRDCSHRKGLILDPFAGSGTILLAAERTGRYARAIEIDSVYVDVAITRWQRVTGKDAVLATGQTWQRARDERRDRKVAGEQT